MPLKLKSIYSVKNHIPFADTRFAAGYMLNTNGINVSSYTIHIYSTSVNEFLLTEIFLLYFLPVFQLFTFIPNFNVLRVDISNS